MLLQLLSIPKLTLGPYQPEMSKFFGPLKLFDGEVKGQNQILVHIKTFQTDQTLDPLK